MPRRTIEQLVEDRGYDDDVEAAVLEDIARHGTADKIVSGALVLPTVKDARMWHDRVTGKAAQTATERTQATEISDLQRRLDALEAQHIPAPSPPHEGA